MEEKASKTTAETNNKTTATAKKPRAKSAGSGKTTTSKKSSATPKTTPRTRRKSSAKPAVSVIIPVYNMADFIPTMYERLVDGLKEYGKTGEIILVDDASEDSTWEVLQEIAKKDKSVKLIRMRNTFGEASCFDAGLKNSEGEVVVYAAARVRADLFGIAGLLKKLDEGNDLVVGWRWPRKDSELNQKVSRWFNALVHRLGNLKLNDINSSIFAARRSMLDNVTFYGDLNIFLPLLAHGKGYKVVEEKIEQMPGEFRQSKYFGDYINRLLDFITVIFLTRYSKRPLHFLGFIGMILTLSGGLMSAYLFVYRLFGFGAIAGRPLLLLGTLLLVIGLQMISIGLIGEMIIYTHAREIREYNIETVVGQ